MSASAAAAPQYSFMPGGMPPQGGLPPGLPQLPGACLPMAPPAYGQYMAGWDPAAHGLQPPGMLSAGSGPLPSGAGEPPLNIGPLVLRPDTALPAIATVSPQGSCKASLLPWALASLLC